MLEANRPVEGQGQKFKRLIRTVALLLTFHSAKPRAFLREQLSTFHSPHFTGTTTAMPAEKDHHKDEEETSNASTLGKHALEQENEPAANAEESGMCLCIKNSLRNSGTKTRKANNIDISTLECRL